MLETMERLSSPNIRDNMRKVAFENVERWKAQSGKSGAERSPGKVKVMLREGDWGEVALDLTKEYGLPWVVLNMANAVIPGGGGGYLNGTPAQEENMFRRTDCHFGLGRTASDFPVEE